MAGGPIYPISSVPITPGEAAPILYDGPGAAEDKTKMLGISAAHAADAVMWHLVFPMPPVLPTSGTGKLRVLARTTATANVIGLNIKTASVAAGEDASDQTFTDEASLDITTSTADVYDEGKKTITSANLVADEMLHVQIEIDDSAHTVANECGLLCSVIWE